MRRFAFRLERVLELRDYAERQAKAALGEKSAACSRLGLALEENAKATASAARERFRPGSGSADHRAAELYSLRLGQARERLMRELALAEAERETARLAYVEASKAREIVQKLRDRKEAEYYRLVAREETKIMDDLASGVRARAASESLGVAGT